MREGGGRKRWEGLQTGSSAFPGTGFFSPLDSTPESQQMLDNTLKTIHKT